MKADKAKQIKWKRVEEDPSQEIRQVKCFILVVLSVATVNTKSLKRMVNMSIKRIVTACLGLMIVFTIAVVPASANTWLQPYKNNRDTRFTFVFDRWGKANTVGRAKQDTSGTYIVAYSMCSGGLEVFVDGLDTTTGQWVDCTDKTTYGQPRLSSINRPALISQWVYELGYRTARLGGYKPGANQSVSGVWSPDSVGNYRYLTSYT